MLLTAQIPTGSQNLRNGLATSPLVLDAQISSNICSRSGHPNASARICPVAQLVKACDCYLQLRVCNHKIVSSSLTGADKEAYVTFFLLCLPLCRSRAAQERVS